MFDTSNIIYEYTFDVRCGIFASGTVGLPETAERDIIPIGDITPFHVMIKQMFDFHISDKSI